jgi:hypothetical protein
MSDWDPERTSGQASIQPSHIVPERERHDYLVMSTENVKTLIFCGFSCGFSLTDRIHFGIMLFRLPIVLLPLEGWRAAKFNYPGYINKVQEK